MIDEERFIEWAESAKRLSKTYSPGENGKFFYAIPFADVMRQIREMKGGGANDTEAENGQQDL